MTAYVGKRLVQMLITFVLFQTLIFFLLQAQPGDIGNQFMGNPRITPAAREAIMRQFGLDRPIHIQYLTYIKNFWTGNLGISWSQFPHPVSEIIMERLPRTVFLFMSATLLSFWLGFTSGKVLAWKRGGFVEYSSTLIGVILYTVFTPWFGLMMIWIFAFKMGLFPIGKFLTPLKWRGADFSANQVFGLMMLTATILLLAIFALYAFTQKTVTYKRQRIRTVGLVAIFALFILYWVTVQSGMATYALDIAHHLILPVITVTLIGYAGTMLLTRNSMLETLREDYILTARAKGLPEKIVRNKHAARNALLPVVTSLVYGIAGTISGGIITETIFSWPGIGLTYLDAVGLEDIPLATGILLIIGALSLLAHLVADLLYAYLDPRIRY
jgi:peptide/nickel transport system permease protein